ncbi:MAG: hypothetical protein IJE48_05795 [Clostridia bacterium]|nr:hypothetical protein [Clostridia bacterium]
MTDYYPPENLPNCRGDSRIARKTARMKECFSLLQYYGQRFGSFEKELSSIARLRIDECVSIRAAKRRPYDVSIGFSFYRRRDVGIPPYTQTFIFSLFIFH